MENRALHFMGIGGAGISAVAAFAKNSGYTVSGCDIDKNSPYLPELEKLGIKINIGHSHEHLFGIEQLVVTPAIGNLDPDNQELVSAKERNITISIGEEFLAKNILGNKKVIAVTGTHGKSTTTAMVGWMLEKAGLDPNVLVGAVVTDWKTNYRLGRGDYFVLEADEYLEKFLLYTPQIAVVTAVEMDHPEYFADINAVKEAFQKFAQKVRSNGYLVLGKGVNLVNPSAHKVNLVRQDFQLRLIGDFNQDNASLAAQVGKLVGVGDSVIKSALESFNGIARRFEFKGEAGGIKVFEDYAHHPTAIKVTTQAAREKFPNSQIWLIYQPHLFSRTKYLLNEFVEVFKSLPANTIILVDIFAARETGVEDISSQDIVAAVKKDNVKYIGGLEQTADYIEQNAHEGDIVIVMGAGDVYKLSDMLLDKLRNKS